LSLIWSRFLRLRLPQTNPERKIPAISKTANGTPSPTPILAAVDKPDEFALLEAEFEGDTAVVVLELLVWLARELLPVTDPPDPLVSLAAA
jgi:hypothetical protein